MISLSNSKNPDETPPTTQHDQSNKNPDDSTNDPPLPYVNIKLPTPSRSNSSIIVMPPSSPSNSVVLSQITPWTFPWSTIKCSPPSNSSTHYYPLQSTTLLSIIQASLQWEPHTQNLSKSSLVRNHVTPAFSFIMKSIRKLNLQWNKKSRIICRKSIFKINLSKIKTEIDIDINIKSTSSQQ